MTDIYSPLWATDKLNLPRDRATINAWNRSLYALHPVVSTTIDFYSIYPLKFLQVSYDHLNVDVATFFQKQVAILNLEYTINTILKDLWLIGESFIYLELSEKEGRWDQIKFNNPDYVIVKQSILGDYTYFLRPDENLRRAVFDKDKEHLCQQLDKTTVDLIKAGENIPMNNFYFSHLVRKISPYEIRGTGILMPIFQYSTLLYDNELPFEEKEKILNTIKQAIYFPYDLQKGIIADTMKLRITHTMSNIKNWLETKVFSPIAKINNFYTYENGEKKLAIPSIIFDADDLFTDLPEIK